MSGLSLRLSSDDMSTVILLHTLQMEGADFGFNQLTGSLPSSWGNLTKASKLPVSDATC